MFAYELETNKRFVDCTHLLFGILFFVAGDSRRKDSNVIVVVIFLHATYGTRIFAIWRNEHFSVRLLSAMFPCSKCDLALKHTQK